MASTQHRRTHNILLISKLLSQREGGASPFTLLLDSLEQPGGVVLREYARRGKLSKTHTIFLAFETPSRKRNTTVNVDVFVTCFDKSPAQILQTVAAEVASKAGSVQRCLILIDSLTTLCLLSTQSLAGVDLMAFLSGLLQPVSQPPIPQQPSTHAPVAASVVAVYHQDIPIPLPHQTQTNSPSSRQSSNPYAPTPLALLSYLATTIITIHSLPILLAEKSARDRSVGAPSFGLAEEKEGVLIGLKWSWSKNLKPEEKGVVLELEHRRRSGRGVREWYFLPTSGLQAPVGKTGPGMFRETVTLLDDHPLSRKPKNDGQDSSATTDQELLGMTFELGLTDRQRREREGVVLPYFDAQKGGLGGAAGEGPGEGGRILYEMGVEDDFDEEEDEI